MIYNNLLHYNLPDHAYLGIGAPQIYLFIALERHFIDQ